MQPGANRRPAGGSDRASTVGKPAGGGTDRHPDADRARQRRERAARTAANLRRASKLSARSVAQASRESARFTGRAGRATAKRVNQLTTAQGAGESGLSRIIELHGLNAAGDAALAVSLAGTVFFTVPSNEARDRVALFLVLTMAPFAVLAPMLGPFLDRVRHGRRWAIGATFVTRGLLAWVLAGVVASGSAWLYPAALGCLVASKAYGITRASAVPRLLPPTVSLVTANSRISVAGIAGAGISGGVAGVLSRIGPDWSLRWAALVYLGGMALAITLPGKVDSEATRERDRERGVFKQQRRDAFAGLVTRAITCNLGLRFVSGFLVIFLAFLLRERPIGNGPALAAAVVVAAGIGSGLGTLAMALLRSRPPERLVFAVLVVDVAVAILATIFYDGLVTLLAIGLLAGLCQSLGKLALDAVIQRDVPDIVRTSVFARSETLLQLAWVVGGGIGIVLPLIPRLGFGLLSGVLVIVLALVIRMLKTSNRRPQESSLSASPRNSVATRWDARESGWRPRR